MLALPGTHKQDAGDLNVLAIDPGGMSGVATYIDEQHRAWAVPFEETGEECQKIMAQGLDLVVCESFHIGSGTIKKGRQGQMSIELIGVLRYLSKCYGIEFALQSPADAKGFSTDAKLRKMGWWSKGLDHPRDASRHLLLALANRRVIDLHQLLAAAP